MKVTTHFCDRCKRETSPLYGLWSSRTVHWYESTVHDWEKHESDLCKECFDECMRFIKGNKV